MAKLQKTKNDPVGDEESSAEAVDREPQTFERRRNFLAQCGREWTADECERVRRALSPELVRQLFLVCGRTHGVETEEGGYRTQRYHPCTAELRESLVRLCESHLEPAAPSTALFPTLPTSLQSHILTWCATRDAVRIALACRAGLRLARLPASWHTVDLRECATISDFAWVFPDAAKRAHTLRIKCEFASDATDLCALATGTARRPSPSDAEFAYEEEKEWEQEEDEEEEGKVKMRRSNRHVRCVSIDATRQAVDHDAALRLTRAFPELRELEILAGARPPSGVVVDTLLDGFPRLAAFAIRVGTTPPAHEKRRAAEQMDILLPPTLERYVDECGARDRHVLLAPSNRPCALRALECTRYSRFTVDADAAPRLAQRLPLLETLRHRPHQTRGNVTNSLAERSERAWADAIATLPALTCLEWPCLPADDAEIKVATPIRIERAQFWALDLPTSRSFRFLSAWVRLRDLRINRIAHRPISMRQLIASVCGAVDAIALRYLQLPWDPAGAGYAFIDVGDRRSPDDERDEKAATTDGDAESRNAPQLLAPPEPSVGTHLFVSSGVEAALLVPRAPHDADDDRTETKTPPDASRQQLPHTRGFGPSRWWRHLPTAIAEPTLVKLLRKNCLIAFGEAAPAFEVTPTAVYRCGVCPYAAADDLVLGADDDDAQTCHCRVVPISVAWSRSLTLVEAAGVVGVTHCRV